MLSLPLFLLGIYYIIYYYYYYYSRVCLFLLIFHFLHLHIRHLLYSDGLSNSKNGLKLNAREKETRRDRTYTMESNIIYKRRAFEKGKKPREHTAQAQPAVSRLAGPEQIVLLRDSSTFARVSISS